MTKREKIKILKDSIKKMKTLGMCNAVCRSQNPEWLTPYKLYDIDRAQMFLKSVGINRPRKTFSSSFWYDPDDKVRRIRIMQRAIKRLTT